MSTVLFGVLNGGQIFIFPVLNFGSSKGKVTGPPISSPADLKRLTTETSSVKVCGI